MKLRSAYGSQAIILSTREVSEGGLLGSGLFSRKLYEIDFMLQEDGTSGASRPLISTGSGGGARDRSALGRALFDAAARNNQANPPEQESLRQPDSANSSSLPAVSRNLATMNSGQDSTRKSIPPLSAMQPGVPEMGNHRVPQTAEEIALEREALNMLLSDSEAGLESADFAGVQAKAGAARGSRLTAETDAARLPDALPGAESNDTPRTAGLPIPGSVSLQREEDMSEHRPGAGEGDERFGRILHQIRGRLLSSQVSKGFADRFLRQVDHSLSRVERTEYRNVEERSLKKLAEVIRTVPDIAPRHGECQAVMLMGPTGAGKTTSLAKLAARYHIMQGREVSIYSLDHYRLAATEQLKTYAGVMDVPFFAPLSPRDFSEYLRRDGAELMLIDTSGIGYRDADRIEQLQEYVDACEVRLEKHLVLAANTNAGMLEKILLAYDRIGLDKIILTKLDESDFLGAFIELADKYNRPFSFLMNGQDVPGSILEAESLELARMVLSGSGDKGDGNDSGDIGNTSSGI